MAPSMGPLVRSADNPNYFARPDGKPVYLTGSHYWDNIQDEGTTLPLPTMDFTAYIAWMVANKFTFMRGWMIGEQPYGQSWSSGNYYIDPNPWSRSGSGTANDGGSRFNIDVLNQAYFDRLRARVVEAGNSGIYASVMLFEGWSLDNTGGQKDVWPYHPFNVANNTNGYNGDPSANGNGFTYASSSAPSNVIDAQRAYVRKVVDTVNDLDHIVYEISNESHPGSTQWQYDLINYVRTYESGKPKQHPIGMTMNDFDNTPIFSSPADWVSPSSNGYISNPPANDGSKVILIDTDHIWGAGGTPEWVWQSFTGGLQPLMMDDLTVTGIDVGFQVLSPPIDATTRSVRTGMTQTSNYAARMDLRHAFPNGGLASTGYMLANPGVQYLAFTSGGSFTVNLSAGSGQNFSVEWLNIGTSAISSAANVAGGSASQSFTPPFGGSAALFLNKL